VLYLYFVPFIGFQIKYDDDDDDDDDVMPSIPSARKLEIPNRTLYTCSHYERDAVGLYDSY